MNVKPCSLNEQGVAGHWTRAAAAATIARVSSGDTIRRDFWRSSGFHLLDRDDAGRLIVTDEFLRAYFVRPEMLPTEESCPAEMALHEVLLSEPGAPVGEARLAMVADADARDNYRAVLRFRDLLLASGTIEAAYLALFEHGPIDLPPLFVDHLAHAILRNLLDGGADVFRLRAAELLFRAQTASVAGGTIMLADEETVQQQAGAGGAATLDVLSDENAASYWRRSDRFDLALDLSFGRPGLDALCRVLEDWVTHLLGVAVQIEPVGMIRDERWSWHIGLDAEASALLNDLYAGIDVGEARLTRLLSLFRLGFRDPAEMRPDLAGRPVYLGLAMTPGGRVRLKPQNLIVNLPLARAI